MAKAKATEIELKLPAEEGSEYTFDYRIIRERTTEIVKEKVKAKDENEGHLKAKLSLKNKFPDASLIDFTGRFKVSK